MVIKRSALMKASIVIWLSGMLYAYVSYLANDATFTQKVISPAAKIARHIYDNN